MSLRKQDLTRVSEYLWEIPTTYRHDMRVPVRLYADDRLLEDALGDQSLVQAVNVAALPGLVGYVIVMPDVHQGYGMPIGGGVGGGVARGGSSPAGAGVDS